jgi:hypothetical protein
VENRALRTQPSARPTNATYRERVAAHLYRRRYFRSAVLRPWICESLLVPDLGKADGISTPQHKSSGTCVKMHTADLSMPASLGLDAIVQLVSAQRSDSL